MTEKTVSFRVDEKIKDEFELIAKAKDLTSSQLLRAFMKKTIESEKHEAKK